MDVEKRIQQFRQMSEADPDNELGHFSLGKAYLEAKRPEEAFEPLKKTLALCPKMSKAYQLLGQAYDAAGKRDQAVEIVTKGVTMADDQGDRVPRDAMIQSLRDWGAEVPAIKDDAAPSAADTDSGSSRAGFGCSRCGQPRGQLAKPPFKGELGLKVFENICQSCWREWIGMGTKVINELSLVLSDPKAQEVYDQHMVEFLQLESR